MRWLARTSPSVAVPAVRPSWLPQLGHRPAPRHHDRRRAPRARHRACPSGGAGRLTSYDLLLLDSAEHFFLRALHSAQLADYPFMAAKALARLAETYIEDGQYGDAM